MKIFDVLKGLGIQYWFCRRKRMLQGRKVLENINLAWRKIHRLEFSPPDDRGTNQCISISPTRDEGTLRTCFHVLLVNYYYGHLPNT